MGEAEEGVIVVIERLKQIIQDGEGLTVEFKDCENEISSSVYETVSSFSNRYGGYMFLGIENSGVIKGVNPDITLQQCCYSVTMS